MTIACGIQPTGVVAMAMKVLLTVVHVHLWFAWYEYPRALDIHIKSFMPMLQN